jgi:hypothetical protein
VFIEIEALKELSILNQPSWKLDIIDGFAILF